MRNAWFVSGISDCGSQHRIQCGHLYFGAKQDCATVHDTEYVIPLLIRNAVAQATVHRGWQL